VSAETAGAASSCVLNTRCEASQAMPRRKLQLAQAAGVLTKGAKNANAIIDLANHAANVANQTNDALSRLRASTSKLRGTKSRTVPVSTARSITAPVAMSLPGNTSGFSEVSRSSVSVRVRGSTCLGVATTSPLAGTSSNQLLMIADCNPAHFPDRLGVMATTYDKYVYHSIRAIYSPACGTTTSGAIMMYFERDALDEVANPGTPSAFLSAENAGRSSVWAKLAITMARDPHERRTYFTNSQSDITPRESHQFKLVVAGAGLASVASQTLGFVTLEYDLELISPVLAPREISASTPIIDAVYNQANGNANFVASSAATTAIPFGLGTFIRQFGIIEIVIADTAGANFNTGFTGTLNGPALPGLYTGMTFYLIADGTKPSETAVAYNLYNSLESAMTRNAGYFMNSNGAATNLFTGNVAILYRPMGGLSRFV